MERRVKERLIGASILVALIVLVVPELLSGPKLNAPARPMLPAAASEPVRNVTVDLSTSKPPPDVEAESTEAQPPASAAQPESPDTAPVMASAEPAKVQVTQMPIAQPPAPLTKAAAPKPVAAKAVPLESASFPPISATHAWSVQLGSFANRANADNLSRQLKGQGYPVYVSPGGTGAGARYRVRVGPLADRQSAERMAGRLKSQGHVSSLVAPAA